MPMDPKDFPEAECGACGDGLGVTGREENGQTIITVTPCECGGDNDFVVLKFGELDALPETPDTSANPEDGATDPPAPPEKQEVGG